MIKITDKDLHSKHAKLDADDNPIKVVGDHLRIAHYVWDELPAPHVFVTLVHHDPKTGLDVNPRRQIDITGAELEYLLTPKADEPGRKYGQFRPSDIEECIVHFGNWPSQPLKDKVELVKD